MSTTATIVQDAINKVINEQTFTGAALKQINEALMHAENVEKRLANSEAKVSLRELELITLHSQHAAETKRADMAEDMAQSIARAEARALVAEAKAATLESCFALVFRNQQVHKSTTSSVPLAMNDPGGFGHVVTDHSTESTVSEVK
jgi:hypothetical protein